MFTVIIIFCDCACTYLCSFLWLIMLKTGNFARGCAHSFHWFACPSFFIRFFLFIGLGFPSLFVVSLATISSRTFLFLLALFYSTLTLLDTNKLFPKNLPGDLWRQTDAFCAMYSGIRPTPCLKTTNKCIILFVELTNETNEKGRCFVLRTGILYCLRSIPGMYQYLMAKTKKLK